MHIKIIHHTTNLKCLIFRRVEHQFQIIVTIQIRYNSYIINTR